VRMLQFPMPDLSEWLTNKINLSGIGVERIANIAGMTRWSVYKHMSNKSVPSEEHLRVICAIIGADPEEALSMRIPKRVGAPPGKKRKPRLPVYRSQAVAYY
jgi:predicted DNA-binding transcriptional regulator AlpA